MSHYPHLFSPLTINGMTLKNRIIMPPMGTNMATLNGEVSQEQLEYYELRAKGGTGLITIENICIDFPFASNGTTQLRIDNDQYIPRLFKLTETLHKHGACVSIQLNHAGASAYAYRLDGQTPLSSSTTPSKKHGNIPRPMTHEEIYHAVEKFGDAAERVRRAGFDSVEIHAGHSYLISQFLSPLFNKRTDEFGGSVENRTRILSLIIDKVRACVGPRFPVSLRISADDFLKGGNTLEDSLRILELCQDKVDIINVSAAQNDNLNLQIDQMSLEDGWKRYLSRAVRDKFHKPTVIAGNIRSPQVAEDILASGDADLIAIGRGLIAEPEWVQKVKAVKSARCANASPAISVALTIVSPARARCAVRLTRTSSTAMPTKCAASVAKRTWWSSAPAPPGWKQPARRRKSVAIPGCWRRKTTSAASPAKSPACRRKNASLISRSL